ncbi:unnamed protein product [Cyclocybe aegerita]|uniref:F-box domain-containing protein n=1 Tax=Cyclocybe aegerita TaxID=1973307 RepID=A0A8S0VSB5_CYCAE|nr:unnamed protein product [Cyclocybe aegerita]
MSDYPEDRIFSPLRHHTSSSPPSYSYNDAFTYLGYPNEIDAQTPEIDGGDPWPDPMDLPHEITEKIFFYACQRYPNDDKWYCPFYPLYFGRVCRAWRQLAWATSSLWTTVVIRQVEVQSTEVQSQLLEEWLKRTQGRPLEIYFGTWVLYFPQRVLHLLVHYREQWAAIKFVKIPHQTLNPNSSQNMFDTPVFFPQLTSVTVERHRDATSTNIALLDFSQTPALRDLSVINLPGTNFHEYIIHQRGGISRLSLTNNTYLDLIAILKRYPQLEELILSSLPGRVPAMRRTDFHRHPRLMSISIRSSLWQAIARIFHSLSGLSFPALNKLDLDVSNSDPVSMSQLPPFIQPLDCMLTSLSLTYPIREEFTVIDLLFSSPFSALRELYLTDSSMGQSESGLTAAFFEALQVDDPEEALLPRLEVFNYHGRLGVFAIDFLDPLIIRSRIRCFNENTITHSTVDLDDSIAVLRKIEIKADQDEFTIAEYTDALYVWELIRLMELRILSLANEDGSAWV